MTDKELDDIEERNTRRRELKSAATPGEWIYDPFAFVDAGVGPGVALPREKQMCIVVRPRIWFDKLFEKYGSNILDDGISRDDLQAYYDADYIAKSRNDPLKRTWMRL